MTCFCPFHVQVTAYNINLSLRQNLSSLFCIFSFIRDSTLHCTSIAEHSSSTVSHTAASNIVIQLDQLLTKTHRKIRCFMKGGLKTVFMFTSCVKPCSHKTVVHMSFITLPKNLWSILIKCLSQETQFRFKQKDWNRVCVSAQETSQTLLVSSLTTLSLLLPCRSIWKTHCNEIWKKKSIQRKRAWTKEVSCPLPPLLSSKPFVKKAKIVAHKHVGCLPNLATNYASVWTYIFL